MLTAFIRMQNILALASKQLNQITERESSKISLDKWSKKQILGHLIDSAANNHQRFVRLQIENYITLPKYNQDEWVKVQHWQEKEWKDIIDLWQLYNQHITFIFQKIDTTKLSNILVLEENEFTLQFLVDDYVDHLEHHLQQIFNS